MISLTGIPIGWELTHLISLGQEWQVNIRSDEHVAIGTGITPDDALTQAIANANDGKFAGRLFHLSNALQEVKTTGKDLLATLGLGSKPIKRRKA